MKKQSTTTELAAKKMAQVNNEGKLRNKLFNKGIGFRVNLLHMKNRDAMKIS